MVFVQPSRERRRDALFGKNQHLEHYAAPRRNRAHLVENPDYVARTHDAAVHQDVPPDACLLRQGPRFEDAGRTNPPIDADAIHDAEYSAKAS